jgi:hypothetical protein
MKLIYIIKQKRQLVQIERKWCNKLNRDNLKLKLYTVHNLWEETPLPPYSVFYDSMGATSKQHYLLGLPNGSPKVKTFNILKFWSLIFSLD